MKKKKGQFLFCFELSALIYKIQSSFERLSDKIFLQKKASEMNNPHSSAWPLRTKLGPVPIIVPVPPTLAAYATLRTCNGLRLNFHNIHSFNI